MSLPRNPRDDMADHQRMIIAVLLSLGILLGYQFFFAPPPPPSGQEEAAQQAEVAREVEIAREDETLRPRAEVLAGSDRLPVRGAKVTGSVPLRGARLDDLLLNDHYLTVAREQRVPLLNPAGAPLAFYAESGWLAPGGAARVPGADAVWTVAPDSPRAVESGGAPVVLRWDNGAGLAFEREIALDDRYLFTITQRVINNSGAPVTLNPYHLVARKGRPIDFSGLYTLHEGPVAQLGDKLYEPSYSDLEEGEVIEVEGTRGWAGITDKYWLAALLPDPAQAFNARILGRPAQGEAGAHYQADIVGPAVTVAPGGSAQDRVHVYAGVKDFATMSDYEEAYGFYNLDNAIDFGIWYLITKPFYMLFHLLISALGSAAAAILAVTVIVRGLMFPLATRSYVAMAKMKKIAPEMKALQEKHGTDKAKLQMELFELYKRENANPFSGCWPMIVQIPVFFALYKVILISVDLRHAPFWGWIEDMSAPDPTSVFNLFGLIPFDPPQLLMIGAWPVIFCLTMVVQKRLSPPMPDPVQEKMQSYFPYFITVMLAHFASGLVIYWAWSNMLAVLQQYYILRRHGGEDVSLIRGHHERRGRRKGRSRKDGSA